MQQLLSHIVTIVESKNLERGFATQGTSFVRVDVTHHKTDIILTEMVKGCTLRKNSPNKSVTILHIGFLIGCHRVAVKDTGAKRTILRKLHSFRIGEFAAVISKEYREQSAEVVMSKTLMQEINPINSRLGSIVVSNKCKQ